LTPTRTPFGTRQITLSPEQFFSGNVTPADVLPLSVGEDKAAVVPQIIANLEKCDLVQWACDVVGFERFEIGAVYVEVDEHAAQVHLVVLLHESDWQPHYIIGFEELALGSVELPEPASENPAPSK
jgi:hypothetical protein